MTEEKKHEVTKKEYTVTDPNLIYGFEDTKNEDLIIPRIKVINALSPERIDGIAEEGMILNSLTKEDLTGKNFIPLRQYYSNIWWNEDSSADNRIKCISLNGKIGDGDEGALSCKSCGKTNWDNTKKGKDAQPICTAYLNFLGFIEGDPMPAVLSFAKTNYNEGRKMLSIARSMRASLWNYMYTLTGKKITKDRHSWYIIVPTLAGATPNDVRQLAYELYQSYDQTLINTHYEDVGEAKPTPTYDAQTEDEII